MSVLTYSAEQIVRTAVGMENEAATLYGTFAVAFPAHAATFGALAGMERRHAASFESLLSAALPEDRGVPGDDPLGIARDYLAGIASKRGGEGADMRANLTGQESLAEVLRRAIEAEKDSILFYTALKESAVPATGKTLVEDIIRQEMQHVVELYRILKAAADA